METVINKFLNSKMFKLSLIVGVVGIGGYLSFSEPNTIISQVPTTKSTTNVSESELTPDEAIDVLAKAVEVMKVKDWQMGARLSMIVASDEKLPDDVRGTAFMLLGECAIATNYIDIAILSFKTVLELPNATKEDKEDALDILQKIADIQKDQTTTKKHPPTIFT